MRLNDLSPAAGSKQERLRVGRGIGSGVGKTAGRGTKGQHARSGGYHKTGFEGGQMPLQRRLPRSGFVSHIKSSRAELRLSALAKLEGAQVDLATLLAADLIPLGTERVKLILSGEVSRAYTIGAGVVPTRGARAAIEQAGGKIAAADTARDTAKAKSEAKPAAADTAQPEPEAKPEAKPEDKDQD